MNRKNVAILVLTIFFISSLCFNGYYFYLNSHKEPQEPILLTLRDTFIINDTVIVEKIRYKTKYDTIISHDVNVNDTVYQVTDTISLDVDHKQAMFSVHNDTIDINTTVLYHGIMTGIDSVSVGYNLHYNYIPPPVKQRKVGLVWCVGIGGGYGYQFSNNTYSRGAEVGIYATIGLGGLIK